MIYCSQFCKLKTVPITPLKIKIPTKARLPPAVSAGKHKLSDVGIRRREVCVRLASRRFKVKGGVCFLAFYLVKKIQVNYCTNQFF